MQSGAGDASGFSDAAYTEAGPEMGLRKGATVISLVNPTKSQDKVDALKAQGINLMALDLLPRMLSRAQAFDVLSSMANIAGYRDEVEALGGEFLVVPGFEDEDGAGAGGYAKEIS